MPKDTQSYVDKTVQTNRSGKTGGLKGTPDVGRELGKKLPAGNEIRKKEGGSISQNPRKLG